jgi:multidrug efflux pump subunit AcrA (membrane-fusion protein)
MKIIAPIVLSVLAVVGCSKQPPANTEAPSKKEEAKPSAGLVTLDADAQKQAGVVVAALEPRVVSESISANGQITVNEDQTWHVGAVADGKVTQTLVKVGDFVRAGQVLAYIHSHIVHDARASYQQAQAELDRANSALTQAKRSRDRAGRLLVLQAVSQEQRELAESEVRTAESAVRKAEADVQKERTHLTEVLEVSVESESSQHRGADDDGIPIKAPSDGTVFRREVGPGSVMTAGSAAFTITNTASLWLVAAVNEADLAEVQPGQPVEITVKAYPDRVFRGRILKLGEEMDPVTRTLKVRVLVPNPGAVLKPEMFATASILRKNSRSAIFVPEGAIQELNGHRVVFIRKTDTQFEPRAIQTGVAANGTVEVTAGLKASDQIVIKGSFLVKSQLLKSSLEGE